MKNGKDKIVLLFLKKIEINYLIQILALSKLLG